MKIVEYVKENWDKLPKSSFNSDECVIVHEIHNDNGGWGHHSYEGVGVGQSGDVYWCYSSGCSCQGSCHADNSCIKDFKTFLVDKAAFPIGDLNPEEVKFDQLAVSFSDY